MLHEELSHKIISAYYTVYNKLGFGFLEKVYENAMRIELRKLGFQVEQQKQINVFYEGENVGEYYADIIVNNLVILELKAVDSLAPVHEAQLINYLKATEIELGLLFNFGPKPEFLRRIFTNNRKNLLAKTQFTTNDTEDTTNDEEEK
ncbi:MAG: GxxExxY protein [Ignavibacteriae bacterium]|nr:GxxExxY protein [Ignavibacteriota bacterium]